jgi:dephospho-CoA kinase
MIIAGLTGSIGMGKSTAVTTLCRLGCSVHEADKAVYQMMKKGGEAVPLIKKAFSGAVPEVIKNNQVDRTALGDCVFNNFAFLDQLESLIHPLVHDSEATFLLCMAMRRERLVFLDVPLLFETGAEEYLHTTVLVTAPSFIQERRALRRPGMTRDRLATILSRQMPDREKRDRADFIVQTGLDRGHTLRQLHRVVRLIRRGYGSL